MLIVSQFLQSVGKDSHCKEESQELYLRLFFYFIMNKVKFDKSRGKREWEHQATPKDIHEAPASRASKGEWHDLKSTQCTDIMKMIELLLKEYAPFNGVLLFLK